MIYPEMLAAREIVSAIRRPWTRQYWELFGGALILIGVKVRENSRLVNKQLAELLNEQKLYHIVAIKRQYETIIPRGTDYPAISYSSPRRKSISKMYRYMPARKTRK